VAWGADPCQAWTLSAHHFSCGFDRLKLRVAINLNLETMGDQSTLQALADAPFPLTEVDKWVLSQSDEDYKLHDWDDLRRIIGV
jgi:hypothetical protein